MTTEEQAATIEAQMRADMKNTLHRNGMDVADQTWLDIILDELVRDGMFHVEHLLTKVEWDHE